MFPSTTAAITYSTYTVLPLHISFATSYYTTTTHKQYHRLWYPHYPSNNAPTAAAPSSPCLSESWRHRERVLGCCAFSPCRTWSRLRRIPPCGFFSTVNCRHLAVLDRECLRVAWEAPGGAAGPVAIAAGAAAEVMVVAFHWHCTT